MDTSASSAQFLSPAMTMINLSNADLTHVAHSPGYPGTKKPSYIEPKKRGAMMAKVRAKAEAAALLGKK